MPTGIISRAWIDNGIAYLTVSVAEGQDPSNLTNWTGKVVADAPFLALAPAAKLAALVAACKAARDTSLPPPTTTLPLTGSVTL